jgi:glycosyltransferase involved in cell wall biosynthesis
MNQRPAPIKVMYLITDLKFGGAQTLLLELLKRLDRKRYLPQVACLFGGDSPLGKQIQASDVPLTDLRMHAWWRLDALWRLYRLLRKERPAILHASLFHAIFAARVTGRLAGTPVILSWRHNVNIGGRAREWVNRVTAPLDDGVIAVSEKARQAEIRAASVPADKVRLIYNGIDPKSYAIEKGRSMAQHRTLLRHELGIPAQAFLIGAVGRLHPQKGLSVLLEAFAAVLEQIPQAWLVLVGEGELHADLENRASALGISDSTTFAGRREDIPAVLSTLDVFVLPSLWEGLPMALLEAMATGLPVIATEVGGTPEVVVDGETGILIPADDVKSLEQAICILLDENLRQRLGQAGQARVRKLFSIQHLVEQMEALYAEQLVVEGVEA